MNKNHHEKFTSFFKAICDKHRQEILTLLHSQESENVSGLVAKLGISQPTVSHHLKILAGASIIRSEKRGKEVFYSLNKGHIGDRCHGFMRKMGCKC